MGFLYRSDIDSIDAGCVPGTGDFPPREALKFMQIVAREGLCGVKVVEVSSPYGLSDITALLRPRAVADVLATLVEAGHLGERQGG